MCSSWQALTAEHQQLMVASCKCGNQQHTRWPAADGFSLWAPSPSIPECGFLIHHPNRYFPSKLCRAAPPQGGPLALQMASWAVYGGLTSSTAQTFHADGFFRYLRGWLLGEFCWHNISAVQWVKASPFPTQVRYQPRGWGLFCLSPRGIGCSLYRVFVYLIEFFLSP